MEVQLTATDCCNETLPFLHPVCLATCLQVAFTAILWGCGTAVGEVPPYFLSYKAASAGHHSKAYDEIQQAVQEGTSGGGRAVCPIKPANSESACRQLCHSNTSAAEGLRCTIWQACTTAQPQHVRPSWLLVDCLALLLEGPWHTCFGGYRITFLVVVLMQASKQASSRGSSPPCKPG